MGFMEEMDMQRPSREAGLYLPQKEACLSYFSSERGSLQETMQEEAEPSKPRSISRSRGLRSPCGWSRIREQDSSVLLCLPGIPICQGQAVKANRRLYRTIQGGDSQIPRQEQGSNAAVKALAATDPSGQPASRAPRRCLVIYWMGQGPFFPADYPIFYSPGPLGACDNVAQLPCPAWLPSGGP